MTNLTPAQHDAFAQRLAIARLQALDELRRNVQSAADEWVQDMREVHSNADSADAQRQGELRCTEILIDRRRVDEVEHAQRRLEQGVYGLCLACGETIPRERLFAQPAALRCTACQAEFEQR